MRGMRGRRRRATGRTGRDSPKERLDKQMEAVKIRVEQMRKRDFLVLLRNGCSIRLCTRQAPSSGLEVNPSG